MLLPLAPPSRHTPIFIVVGFLVLYLLHAPASVLALTLTWLSLWVWHQMNSLDTLHRGSFFLSLAYALLAVCVCFFHASST